MNELSFINPQKLLPKNIDIISHEIGINELIKYLEKGEIVFENSGKNTHLTNTFTKSKVIENILLNIPLPILYLDRTDKGKFRPIDVFGYEFLYAIQDFIHNNFALTNLEFLPRLNNLTYEQIPESDRRTIFWRVISFRYLTSNTPNVEKYAVINRVTSGKGLLQAHDFVPELTEIYRFIKRNTEKKIKDSRFKLFANKNYISSFIALYLNFSALNDDVTFEYFKNKTLLSITIENGEIVEKLQNNFYDIFHNAFEKLASLLEYREISLNKNTYLCLLFILTNNENSQKIATHKNTVLNNLETYFPAQKHTTVFSTMTKLNEIIAKL